MKKQFLAIAALAITSAATAQVGINNTAPTATLDITAKTPAGTTSNTNEGLLIPRVTRERVNSITSPVTSTMIYVNDVSTGAASGASVNIDAVGFYYYNGVAWTKMGAGAAAALTANNGLTETSGNIQLGGALTQPTTVSGLTATNTLAFTGTGANAFSVDGSTLSVDAANDRLGIGTAAPGNDLHISDGSVSGMTSMNAKGIAITKNAAAPGIYMEHLGAPSGSKVFYVGSYNGLFGIYPLTDDAGSTVPVAISPPSIAIKSPTGNVGVLNATPAATLDIAARNNAGTSTAVDGILIPRVTRQRAQSMTSVPVSTLVYITEATTGTQTLSTQFVDAPGFYYSDGTNWLKMGASAATAPLNVTGEQTGGSYTATATDDIILINDSSPAFSLTLPTTGITVGKKLYVSQNGTANVAYLPANVIRNGAYQSLNGGSSAVLVYIGGGKWDQMSGF